MYQYKNLVLLFLVSFILKYGFGQTTYEGDLTLTTQAEVDAFEYNYVSGTLTLTGNDISNIDGLSNLNTAGGIKITNTSLTSLINIGNLTNVSSIDSTYIEISNNALLRSIEIPYNIFLDNDKSGVIIKDNPVLDSISRVNIAYWDGGELSDFKFIISNNNSLKSINLEYSEYISVTIANNPNLKKIYLPITMKKLTVDANNQLDSIFGLKKGIQKFKISNNPRLKFVATINSATVNAHEKNIQEIFIQNNAMLTHLDFLKKSYCSEILTVKNNTLLSACCGLEQMINNPDIIIDISGNPVPCHTDYAVRYSCTPILMENEPGSYYPILNPRTYNGDLVITKQAQIDTFFYTHINGSLTLRGGNIVNSKNLDRLNTVGNITIDSTQLKALSGFYNIIELNGYNHAAQTNYPIAEINITNNASLKNIDSMFVGNTTTSGGCRLRIDNNNAMDKLIRTSHYPFTFISINKLQKIECKNNASLKNITIDVLQDIWIHNNNNLETVFAPSTDTFLFTNSTIQKIDIYAKYVDVKNSQIDSILLWPNEHADINFKNIPNLKYISTAWVDNIKNYKVSDCPSLSFVSKLRATNTNRIDSTFILDNTGLENLDFLSEFNGCHNLHIINNTKLSSCCGLYNCFRVNGVNNVVEIRDNLFLQCDNITDIQEYVACDTITDKIFVGDIFLPNQQAIDTFNYNIVTGKVVLTANNITSDNNLSRLKKAGGLFIENTNLTNLSAFDSIQIHNTQDTVHFVIRNNSSLTSLQGLKNVSMPGLTHNNIVIQNNSLLTNLQGYMNIKSVNKNQIVTISGNNNLQTMDGYTDRYCKTLSIINNPLLKKFINEYEPDFVNKSENITIMNNNMLDTISISTARNVRIESNPNLSIIKMGKMIHRVPNAPTYYYALNSFIVKSNSKLDSILLYEIDYCNTSGTVIIENNNKLKVLRRAINSTGSCGARFKKISSIKITNNVLLDNIDMLYNIVSADSVAIFNNPSLSSCCEILQLINNNNTVQYVQINSNKTGCNSTVEIVNVCLIQNNENLIHVIVYKDINNNNKPDSNDTFLNDVKIQFTHKGQLITQLTANKGYSQYFSDTGLYVIQPLSSFNNFITTPASSTINRNTFGNKDTLIFKISSSALVNDASVILSNNWLTRPNRAGSYTISYTNESGQNYSGYVKLKLDNRLNYQNAIPAPNSILNDTLVWNISNFPLYSRDKITVNFIADINLVAGDTLASFARIHNGQTDITPNNNQYLLKDAVLSSYDPNDKAVDKTILSPAEAALTPYLLYTIRFQNVGNDTAFDITILDTLSNHLDWSTFQTIAYSHKFQLKQQNNRYITFDFKNIQLPDSNVNEKASHGYIVYKIKTKNNLLTGNSIENKASIVFDVNAPVVTNIAKTAIMQTEAGNNQAICAGQSTTLIASGANSYLWSNGINAASVTVSPNTTTKYYVSGFVNGISQKDSVIVTVLPLPDAAFTKVLNGAELQLNAPSGNTSYNWSFGDGQTSNEQNPTHIYTQSGKFYITLNTTLNTCNNTKTDSVNINLTAIRNNISFVESINIFPNPAENYISLSLSSNKIANFQITLMDINGKEIYYIDFGKTNSINETLDLSRLGAGIYTLMINSEIEKATYKIIKR